ncbi:hypothetical protein [Microbulbifer elongatus]|uniref:hypothetical protein n=1 Tax=Microbulbifer elongatus TaxID=86173 RepID=UPI001CFE33C9|nr:hypothetical protein [Microbulbifer elongatus]
MKQLIVHAGMPKNGSSAIQVMFAKNRDKLLDLSIDYFNVGEFESGKSGAITSGNGALISRSLLNEGHEAYFHDPDDNLLRELQAKVKSSRAEVGVVSSEFFTNIPASSVLKLKEFCDKLGVELRYFYYVRRQDQFLMSGYMQRVKRHGSVDYPEDFIKASYKNVGFLNYFAFTKQLESVLGLGNVIVRNFDVARKHEKGLAGDFVETVIGNTDGLEIQNEVVNVSPTPKEIKALILLNKFSPSHALTDEVVRNSAKYGRASAGSVHSLLDPSVCKEVLDYFSNQNYMLMETYLPAGHEFDLEVSSASVDLKSLKLDAEDVIEILGALLVRLYK